MSLFRSLVSLTEKLSLVCQMSLLTRNSHDLSVPNVPLIVLMASCRESHTSISNFLSSSNQMRPLSSNFLNSLKSSISCFLPHRLPLGTFLGVVSEVGVGSSYFWSASQISENVCLSTIPSKYLNSNIGADSGTFLS
ncbi:unnamed protein product [Moneuplotes crassus]|uniref:Uncharacterized protein n=1 Tax=Euplotes crassus TaxID=5936 RepID=A0AAD1XP47_EUPCR|nr:unnamed protein product [Moneuplotes crassus]